MPQDLISVLVYLTIDHYTSPLSFLTNRTLILFGEAASPACEKFLANSAAGGRHEMSFWPKRYVDGSLCVSGAVFPLLL